MARLTQADLADMNNKFEERTPQELLQWAKWAFGDRVAAMSAMQRAGSVVCHMISTLKLDMKVLFVDTGVLFPETLETRDRIAAEYGLDVLTLSPEKTMEEQTRELGVLYLTPEGQEQCCELRKTQPLLQVKGKYDALIGSLRRSDGGKREQCPILALDQKMNCVRVNPLATFSDAQFKEYLQSNPIVVNPLHQQGFPTVGCNRCTTPVLENEPRRAGRWRHLGPWSVYCGINPTDLATDTRTYIELPDEVVDRILGLSADFAI